MNNNTNNNSNNNGVNDSLAELLSLPVNFTVDPLLATHPNGGGLPQKRQASFSSASSVSSENEQSSSESIVSIKKSRLSLDDKDQKTKERILRNRAAAQESRDKKRRYVSDLEATNKKLTEENENANKRVKTLEQQNAILNSQLEAFTRQLANLQAQIKFNAATPILFNDFCDSARIAKKECLIE
ncbi:basic-leucine zipper transcription factor [Mucor lusitanicus]|uniref:Basic-leucine zipper transcription factor n=2 Tax=Mucor circinelloides f. lusitanicus TaxID=29924 RepID=A0A168I603_MUCCL|nr:basic-leucine zipper transcription factor [Mucor lusitanicus]OAC99591.1 basic-leucine zipper transcription factor [Mucor lusitanicus CBS 277.49]